MSATAAHACVQVIFDELFENFVQDDACPIGNLQSLHIDIIHLDDMATDFLTLKQPLGVLGADLTSLRFDEVLHPEARDMMHRTHEYTPVEADAFCGILT